MTPEAPIEVDVSQELSVQELWGWLTKEEQIKFNEYFNSDKEWILYLSQMELAELKRILWEDLSASHDADFDEFIDQQLSERLSSSDIFEWIDWIAEGFWDTLDALSKEALFWGNGALTQLPLSVAARNNIITSLSVSILWNIDKETFITWNITEMFNKLMKGFTPLKELTGATQTVGPGIIKNILNVAWDGERNTLFMDANTWVEFFDTLISKPMSKEEIKLYIEKHNLSPDDSTEIENDISGLTTRSAEIMKTLLALPKKVPTAPPETKKPKVDSKETPETHPTETKPEDIPTEDEIDEIIESWWLGAAFIKIIQEIFNMIQGLSGKSEDTDSSKKTEKKEGKTPEVIKKEKSELKKLIEWVPESQKNNSLILALTEGWEKADEIKALIEWISPGEDGASKIDTVLNIFDTQWLSASMPTESSDIDKKILFLKEYAVAWVESGQTKWNAWAEKRKSENWKRD